MKFSAILLAALLWATSHGQFKDLEKRSGGKMGVAVLDTATGKRINFNATQRFAYCSTFKLLLCSAVLWRVDHGSEKLTRAVAIRKADLVPHSDITAQHVGSTMTLREMCEATMTISDNTSANKLLEAIGGRKELTGFVRRLGDAVTRFDRGEPGLNEALPGDPRDTTSPVAMLEDVRDLLEGKVLSAASKKLLTTWLMGCQTGAKRIRAGVPEGWQVGDKTGTGERGTAGDVAILWPPNRKPIYVVVYVTGSQLKPGDRDALFAEVGRRVANRF